ncbi:SCO2400 family protein, partial [Streptomyces mexicanus]|uniref:SCO2400 family protein n=1 Tax=Streptomyces mexicanus TaxID=178566 RepID=UPI003CD0A07A
MDDYCAPCRRHLNGALACPGCGTPADALPARPERTQPLAMAGEFGEAGNTGGHGDPAERAGRAERRRAHGRGQERGRGGQG